MAAGCCFFSQDVKAAELNLEVVLQQNAASCIRRQQQAACRSALRIHLCVMEITPNSQWTVDFVDLK